MPEDLENAGVESAADDLDRPELRETETQVATDERPRLAVRLALRFGALAVVVVAGVVGWLRYHVY